MSGMDKPKVLVVEDDPRIRASVRRALAYEGYRASEADDGESALIAVRDDPPDLILLDLNLPGIDGREVLRQAKGDAALRHIPVVVLTTSEAEEDIFRSYNLGANCYLTKPLSLGEFSTLVQSIQDFWFSIVKLPKYARPR